MNLVARLAIALVAAIVVWLVCFFSGGLMGLMNVPIAAYVGSFLREFAVVLAILAFLWAFFRGGLTL